jgi:uncharacterized membrane protein
MRAPTDRLRHALACEICDILLVPATGRLIFDIDLKGVGVVGLGSPPWRETMS